MSREEDSREVQSALDQLQREGCDRIDIVDITEKLSLSFLEIEETLKSIDIAEGVMELNG